MDQKELEVKKFELEQRVKLEELELKKKELDLRIQEQRSKRISTPLTLSIVGGLITLLTGICLNFFDNKSKIALEDKKFQSSLLLKATEAENYDAFSDMLITFQENGLLDMDSIKLNNFRKKRFISEESEKLIAADLADTTTKSITSVPENATWTILVGGSASLEGANKEKSKAINHKFEDVGVWLQNDKYRTCVGKYASNTGALEDLFHIKEQINKTSRIIQLDRWCPNFKWDKEQKVYICE